MENIIKIEPGCSSRPRFINIEHIREPEEAVDICLHGSGTDTIIKQEEEDLFASPEAEKPKRITLSGAARKRLRKHLANGIPMEEAKRLAQRPMDSPGEVPSKGGVSPRGISANTTPEQASTNRAMINTAGPSALTKGGPPNLPLDTEAPAAPTAAAWVWQAAQEQSPQVGVMATYRDVSNSAKMAILPADYPSSLLTTEELNSIQSAILSRVMALRHGSVKPLFSGCTFRPGWMVVTCGNAETVEWLTTEVPKLRLWKDAHIMVVPEAEAPRAAVFIAYLPLPNADMTTTEILNLIEGQNSSLRVGDWRVFHREMRRNTAVLTISLDPVSANRLKSLGYQLNFAWGTVTLKPKAGTKEQVEAPASTAAATALHDGTADAQEPAAPRKIMRLPLYGRIRRGTGRTTRGAPFSTNRGRQRADCALVEHWQRNRLGEQ